MEKCEYEDEIDKKEKSDDNPGKGWGKVKDDMAPEVIIEEPTETYVQGNYLKIVVTVRDEDQGAVAVISVDMQPTFNTDNIIYYDISDWDLKSEHFISAAYTDSVGKNGGDDHYIVKI